jgi:uncharacterized paraquat-inducible protein A
MKMQHVGSMTDAAAPSFRHAAPERTAFAPPSMLGIADVNRRMPRCAQCGCRFNLVAVERDDQAKLYSLYESNQFLLFVQLIRSRTACSIDEAKATYLHLASTGRRCHRCKSPLSAGQVADCPKCRAVNLVWESRS